MINFGVFSMGHTNRSNKSMDPCKQKWGVSDRSILNSIKQKNEIQDSITIETSNAIIANPEKFKDTLVLAANHYKAAIQDEWFRNDGRKRADRLIQEVKDSKSHLETVSVVSRTIQKGNENPDSLKTFLYLYIVENFCKHKKDEVRRIYGSCYSFLSNICLEHSKILTTKEYFVKV